MSNRQSNGPQLPAPGTDSWPGEGEHLTPDTCHDGERGQPRATSRHHCGVQHPTGCTRAQPRAPPCSATRHSNATPHHRPSDARCCLGTKTGSPCVYTPPPPQSDTQGAQHPGDPRKRRGPPRAEGRGHRQQGPSRQAPKGHDGPVPHPSSQAQRRNNGGAEGPMQHAPPIPVAGRAHDVIRALGLQNCVRGPAEEDLDSDVEVIPTARPDGPAAELTLPAGSVQAVCPAWKQGHCSGEGWCPKQHPRPTTNNGAQPAVGHAAARAALRFLDPE